MAFDAFFLSAVLEEVRTRCIGARVEKIHQPARDTIIVHLRCQEGREKLLFAANPAAPRLHLTAASPENPAQPPMFCMLPPWSGRHRSASTAPTRWAFRCKRRW